MAEWLTTQKCEVDGRLEISSSLSFWDLYTIPILTTRLKFTIDVWRPVAYFDTLIIALNHVVDFKFHHHKTVNFIHGSTARKQIIALWVNTSDHALIIGKNFKN